MEDHELVDRVQRGQLAGEVLNNPVYEESWTKVEQTYFQAWLNSPVRDVEGRENLYRMMLGLREARSHMEQTVTTGKMAATSLNERRSLRDKVREWIG